MTLSDKGLAQLKEFEGFKPVSYADSGGIWTIGIGTIEHLDGSKVVRGETIDLAKAYAYVRHDLVLREHVINTVVTAKLTQDQYDMLICLSYNIGIHGLEKSSVLKSINSGASSTEIIHNWKKWDEVNGAVNQGLLNRRNKELLIYFSGSIPLVTINSIH